MKNKKGQTTAFIIIAILIVAASILFFTLRKSEITMSKIPSVLEPAYTEFLSCLEDDVLLGIGLLEIQGGYIELPSFDAGSKYSPFSSQLNFAGTQIPYWYYVSGNGVQKEQIPSRDTMQRQLALFVESKVRGCDLGSYEELGFNIDLGDPKVGIIIRDNEVEVGLNMNLNINKGEDNILVKNHKIKVDSKLGLLYNSAKVVYEREQKDLFLEEYAVDTLRLYAPVDGIEISCSPLIWNAGNVFDNLRESIEANTLSLKNKGAGDDYFSLDLGVGENVRFVNIRNWSSSYEVAPSNGPALIAEPVGNQPGLGVLGFCYVPYHFVYNIAYPVVVQIYDKEEIFQFPVAVVIRGNNPREPLGGSAVSLGVPELCQYKNTQIEVETYDAKGRIIDADISYECFGTSCYIGETESGSLTEFFPQCVNGRVIAQSEGYEDTSYRFSSVDSGKIRMYLNQRYPLRLELKLDGVAYNGEAIVSFISNESSSTIVYPAQETIELSQGEYELQVYIYEDSSLILGTSTQEQCVKVPRGGIGGVLGLTKDKCFDVEFPEQVVSQALSGGGKTKKYFVDSALSNAGSIEIDAESLPQPKSLEQLQINYILFEEKIVDVNLR